MVREMASVQVIPGASSLPAGRGGIVPDEGA